MRRADHLLIRRVGLRKAAGRLIAGPARITRDMGDAEQVAPDALVANDPWSRIGVPANPSEWLMATATDRAIDAAEPLDDHLATTCGLRVLLSGGGGIRTHERLPVARFQGACPRPLGDPAWTADARRARIGHRDRTVRTAADPSMRAQPCPAGAAMSSGTAMPNAVQPRSGRRAASATLPEAMFNRARRCAPDRGQLTAVGGG